MFFIQNISHPQHHSSISSWKLPSESACRIDGSETIRTRLECGVQPKTCCDASRFYRMPDRMRVNDFIISYVHKTENRKRNFSVAISLENQLYWWWLLYQTLVRDEFTQHLVQMPSLSVPWNELYMRKTMTFPVFHKMLPLSCWQLGSLMQCFGIISIPDTTSHMFLAAKRLGVVTPLQF